jgi:predicted dehydrogenase
MQPVKVGVVGCGNISAAYFRMMKNFSVLEVAACADLLPAAAAARAAEFGIPRACAVDELLADPSIEIVLNLTIPRAHAEIAMRALEAGKHTYAEKPFALDRAEGRRALERARRKKLLVGCAPDTFLGAGLQTARKLIDEGAIGRPVAVSASMQCRGHETWHPNPEFYYEPGGGPMFDMGPYYLTALLNLLGPARRISGMASIAIPERTITHRNQEGGPGPKFGRKVRVETPDHIVGLMEFENGVVGTIVQSFAVIEGGGDGRHPIIVNGTDGALLVPDPNGFDGTVLLKKPGEREAREMPHAFVTGYGRGVGVADMACAVRSGRPFRATGRQGFCVLDLMQGFLDSARTGRAYRPRARYERPAPMRPDRPFGQLEE